MSAKKMSSKTAILSAEDMMNFLADRLVEEGNQHGQTQQWAWGKIKRLKKKHKKSRRMLSAQIDDLVGRLARLAEQDELHQGEIIQLQKDLHKADAQIDVLVDVEVNRDNLLKANAALCRMFNQQKTVSKRHCKRADKLEANRNQLGVLLRQARLYISELEGCINQDVSAEMQELLDLIDFREREIADLKSEIHDLEREAGGQRKKKRKKRKQQPRMKPHADPTPVNMPPKKRGPKQWEGRRHHKPRG